MKILIVSPFLYGKASPSGGEALGRVMLEQLAQRHSLAIVAFTSGQSEAQLAEDICELGRWMDDVRVVPRKPDRWRKLASKTAFFRGDPTVPALYDFADFRAAIRSSVDTFQPDVVIVQFPELAQFVRELSDVPTVLDVVDVYSVSKFRRCVQAEGPLRLVWNYIQWLGWTNYERRFYPDFDMVFTLSDQDTYGLKLFSPSLRAVTAGVAFEAPPTVRVSETEPFTIGFAASFSHRPNVDAIEYFMDEVMPKVRAVVPQARFVVAGRDPPEHLLARRAEGLEFPGFVPDIYDFFRACTIVAVPLLWGGGVKVKVVQALLAGAPVVSTSVGVEGTGAVSGEHALVDDTTEGFTAGVIELLQNAEHRASLGARAGAFAEEAFSWRTKMERIEHILGAARTGFAARHRST